MEPLPYCYIESYVGDSTLLEFRLTNLGQQEDVSSGYTFVLNYEIDTLGTVQTPITVSSAETNADWAHGVVTVRLPAAVDPVRYNVALVSTHSGKVTTEGTGAVLVLHKPGVADA
jgi:hypothetical protein